MIAIISHFQSTHKTRIILVTPSIVEPSVWAAVAKSWGTPDSHAMNRTMGSAQAYATAVLEVGKVMHVPVVDAFTLLATPVQRGERRFEDLLYDGLHYTEQGYTVSFSCGAKYRERACADERGAVPNGRNSSNHRESISRN